MCMDASQLWHAEAAWVLALLDSKDLAWALTREWGLSIHAAIQNKHLGAYLHCKNKIVNFTTKV